MVEEITGISTKDQDDLQIDNESVLIICSHFQHVMHHHPKAPPRIYKFHHDEQTFAQKNPCAVGSAQSLRAHHH